MKNIFLISLFCLGLFTQAQSPKLNVKGKDSALVRLNQLKVSVKIVGNIAYTTTEMHFFNGTNRQMEAELLFPLPEGVSVSRYAIDINGKMREAVPVNKNKGKQVFEAVEHRRVDPGLLEKVEGNNFKTRIYPLMPNNERIVIIGYEQELSSYDATHLSYQMLSSYSGKLDVFDLNVAVVGAIAEPSISTTEGILTFENSNQFYVTSVKKENYLLNDKLQIIIPIRSEIPSVVVQSKDNQHYFYANTILDNPKILKKNPNSIGLIWDVSLSCKNRNLKKELQLLDTYFSTLKNVEVNLYFAGYNFEKKNTYVIKNGDWTALKLALDKVIYDGGTRFSKIKLPVHDEYLFFTDGLSSLSSNIFATTKKPIYTISSSISSDYAFLNFNAIKTGGSFINLNQLKVTEASDKLMYQSLKFLGIKENYMVTDLYPMAGTPVSGSFSVAGISLKNTNDVVLLFGYDEKPVLEKTIHIVASNSVSNEVNIEKLWAQKKIANLEIQYKNNADEIESLGKKYGIATQNTSLIVLESLHDYIQYEIVPPAELREEFDKAMKQQIEAAKAKKYSNWENVATYYEQLLTWWNSDKKYKAPQPKNPKNPKIMGSVQGTVSDSNGGPLPGATIQIKGTSRSTSTDFDGRFGIDATAGQTIVVSFVGMKRKEIKIRRGENYNIQLVDSDQNLQEVVVTAYGVSREQREEQEEDANDQQRVKRSVSYSAMTVRSESLAAPVMNAEKALAGQVAGVAVSSDAVVSSDENAKNKDKKGDYLEMNDVEAGYFTADKTKINKWNPDRVYLKALANAPKDKKYELYLELRNDQINNPSFYFDVANHFYDNGDKEKALLVLSNIADLGLENHQLYKSLTYLLRQWEAYEDALFAANQVAKWREQEPQAHRDLGLTLEDNKQYQAGFDELIKALEVNYYGEMSGQYSGVEDIILMDLNRMIQQHKDIKTDKLDKKYLNKMPVDVRIILNWNQMDTDIDLHVIEPTNEECYYGHRDTEMGARFSKDFTQGYGPEQYLLRNAVKGNYIIKTNYYGESALTENGPTTVMVEIYITKNGVTERKLQTIQLGKIKENQNLAEIAI
ncbi:VIT domain-containing protein [Flavobacterium branchiicola]|uniref:VIT domain-containing protein n=1 Tax=Flavobacterium branchiicola TaxID=1114875 RepID=A0ABV9P7X2_9FLAO|nr:VIT domain-containing protein [Flavobacterium branchiicola]MBS7252488.1 carboxypeptidase-like regulatory domain-containing protein [Flavobacterium branchiicola]